MKAKTDPRVMKLLDDPKTRAIVERLVWGSTLEF